MSNFNNEKIDVNELVEKAKSSKNLNTNEWLNDFINKKLVGLSMMCYKIRKLLHWQ